ncbi:MAG: 4Fe-4S dicluster domain-containing protein [Pseudomonadota bacterium]
MAVDADKCDGCGDCVEACPAGVFEVVDEDPNDPLREGSLAIVRPDKRNKLNDACNHCKPQETRAPLSCLSACTAGSLSHSW